MTNGINLRNGVACHGVVHVSHGLREDLAGEDVKAGARPASHVHVHCNEVLVHSVHVDKCRRGMDENDYLHNTDVYF